MRSHRRVGAACALAAIGTVAVISVQSSASATVAIRQRVFGHQYVDAATGAVDADKVILSWFGVTNFAAAIGGHVVLLDAWIPRGEYSGYVPITHDDLIALQPSHIFLGHGHFDHAADSAPLALGSGATILGTPEHCTQARRQAMPATLSCEGVVPAGSPPGTVEDVDALDGVTITAVKHVHSAAEPPDSEDPGAPHRPSTPLPDFGAVVEHLPAPQDTAHLITHLGDAEGDTILWQFTVGDFTLLWNDSAGPLEERAPHVLDVLRALPETDVQVGAIMGFNQITNGMRDPRMYVEAISPKIYVPSHHDNWAPGVSTRGERYRPIIEEELALIPAAERPVLRFISDPQDYVRPEVLTFDVDSSYWAS
jgi:L-ascorbate metabolism protein UlaG (beta-lactamase superfamily)